MDDLAVGSVAQEMTRLPEARLQLDVVATPLGVRRGLNEIRQTLHLWGMGHDDIGTAEMVLAEVMNNIVEHAYADCAGASMLLSAWQWHGGLAVHVVDSGLPMPDGKLPEGQAKPLNVDLTELPEGGFGWSLIRELTIDLNYCRSDGENHLRFRVPPSGLN